MPRVFVAVYPTECVAEEIAAAATRMVSSLSFESFTPTRVDQLHITVHFAGETGVAELPRVVESVRHAAGGLAAFEVETVGLAVFPEEKRADRGVAARTIVLETTLSPTLAELHRRVVRRLSRRPREEDGYVPHVTLGRFLGAGRLIDRGAVLAWDWPQVSWRVERVDVMESVLRPTGAIHRVLASIGLG